MIKLQVRAQPSGFWTIASPVLALLITVVLGVVLLLGVEVSVGVHPPGPPGPGTRGGSATNWKPEYAPVVASLCVPENSSTRTSALPPLLLLLPCPAALVPGGP